MKIVGAILLLLLTACTTTRKAEMPPANEPTLTVMSYNTARGYGDTNATLNAINTLPADIVCIQEVGDDWARMLQQRCAERFAHIETRAAYERFGSGLAVLSRFPIKTHAYVESNTGWFDGWIVIVTTEAGDIQLLNAHLRPPISDSGSWVNGYFTTGRDRQAEIERFCAQLDPDLPTIVLGDFNESDRGDAMRWLNAQGYTDALREFDRRTHTWQYRTRLLMLKRRLDHILYDARLHCYRAWVEPVGGSDHRPLLATFGQAKSTANRNDKRH